MYVIGSAIGIFFQVTSLFIIVKMLLGANTKAFSLKSVLLMSLYATVIWLSSGIEYSIIRTVSLFFMACFTYKYIFNIQLSYSILLNGITYILLIIADLICSITLTSFFTVSEVRSELHLIIVCNLYVSILSVILIMISPVKKVFQKFAHSISNKKLFDTTIFISMLLVVVSTLLYSQSQKQGISAEYITNILIMIIFFVLTAIFFTEKYQREKANSKYDQLFDYVLEMEDKRENEQLLVHESKNQLATLRELSSKNKKALTYIDSIISEINELEQNINEGLKNLPKGGLKGLLHYKISIARKNELNLEIDISSNVTSLVKAIDTALMKDICRLVGIYCDNAIDATKETKEKKFAVEVYAQSTNLIIIISNSFDDKNNIDTIDNKGMTTKGSGHGNGLYYAKKIVSKNNKISCERKILNGYFIQKIVISK